MKKQYRFRMDDETRQYIDDFAEDNNISYMSHALERIISDTVTENTRSVLIELQQSISNEINRVRLGTNNIDRNKQILIEILQGFMQMQNVEQIVITNIYNPDF